MKHFKFIIICLLMTVCSQFIFGQTEVEPWGNITGIRTEGQLMDFETNLTLLQKDGLAKVTAKEKQRPKFSRSGNTQIISSNIDSLYFKQWVTDTGKGLAHIRLVLTSTAPLQTAGLYYGFLLPANKFDKGSIQLDNNKPVLIKDPTLTSYLQKTAKKVTLISASETLIIRFEKPVAFVIKNEIPTDTKTIRFYLPLHTGEVKNGESISTDFSITAAGKINRQPVQLVINTKIAGRSFEGLGGNFRLQNPAVDPQVIDYCLSNLRVAWGRVEMPWRFWQPSIDTSGIEIAKAGRLNPRVQKSMEMAQRLYKMGMPVIVTAWFPPAWAILGKPAFSPGPVGVWGNPLDHTKDIDIYKSITDYIIYLKNQYGVDVADFSFNESDLGINIRQTGEEHAALIKGLGSYFASKGLQTKILLGDNSDANSYSFIDPAMADTATHQYIGAVSFHSWRGWDAATLQKWADAATVLHRPLLIGEGSIDAAAWAYPAILEEQTYALKEINLYTRLLNICQPASILQWQLTSDYSPVAGGGVYGDHSPMRPTQRFWNLKQLASTPKSLQALQITSSSADISCAALGDNEKKIFSIHIVNNAAARNTSISGLPTGIKTLRVWVTDKQRGMKEEKPVQVKNGRADFLLDATSYTTLQTT